MANQLSINNVINISVSQPGQGLLPYNTSNLAIFTRDSSSNTSNSILGYGLYLDPTDVANDFGASSTTALMANAIFSQQPNILAGNGSLVIIPFLSTAQVAVQEIQYLYQVASVDAAASWVSSGNSMTLTNADVTGLTNIAVGQNISGPGLAANTVVTSVSIGASSTTVGFAPSALASGSGASVNFLSGQGVPASGAFELTWDATASSSIAYNATASTIQGDLRTATSISGLTVSGSPAGVMTVTYTGNSGALPYQLYASTNSLEDAHSNVLVPYVVTTVPGSSGETLDQAINRATPLVQFFGCMAAEIESESIQLLAAAEIQALNKLLFVVSNSSNDIQSGGMLSLLVSGGYTQTRGLYYGDSTEGGTGGTAPINALTFMAAYAGRALSTNFNGSNTTQTMHLKSLSTIQPDPTITQTLLNLAVAAGADTYPSLQGVAKVFSSGANDFFDNQYNLQWLVGALQVAGFNALAQVGTKLPQTEGGMNILKGAYQLVLQQAVSNQFIAPGAWTSSVSFGNQAQLIANIASQGYYIYSQPVSQQLPSIRVTRAAPLIQIGIKYAGAIQSSDVIVYVNP
jgi:hypothetical protein